MSSSAAADPAYGTAMPWVEGGDATGILSRAQQLTRPLLRAAVDTLPTELRLVVGYHLGWWDAAGTPTVGESSGKGLRPAWCSPRRVPPPVAVTRTDPPIWPYMPLPQWNWCTTSPCCTTM